MTNLLTVVEPDEGAQSEATETRALLQAWADTHLPNVQQETLQPMRDADIKSLREFGADQLQSRYIFLQGESAFKPASMFGHLLAAFAATTKPLFDEFPRDNKARELSHAVEGMVRGFHKQFFTQGMKWNLHAEWLACASLQTPYTTSGYADRVWFQQTGTTDIPQRECTAHREAGRVLSEDYSVPTGVVRRTTEERFIRVLGWLRTLAQTSRGDDEYWRSLCGFDYVGTQIHYMDHDGPWVAGFLSVDDACRMRFRRVRLGAYLTEQGLNDAAVRTQVESKKQQVAGATFTAYPNDTQWEGAYGSGPSSCMSDSAREYNTWDGIHPVSTYSSSYWGCGDNSLVLLVSKDDCGNITGRGILNLQDNTIVRWYGDNQAERVLKRAGVNTYNRSALHGSWLAHLTKGSRFIHPYVDGDHGYGRIEDGRVYFSDDAELCLQETGGSSYSGTAYYCEDVEREMGEDECTYQEQTETYISDDCDDWRCPLVGEWVSRYNRTEIVLHGVFAEVSEHAWYRINQYATNMNGGRSKHDTNYSIDDDDSRQEFLDSRGIDDPFEEPEQDAESDEEAA